MEAITKIFSNPLNWAFILVISIYFIWCFWALRKLQSASSSDTLNSERKRVATAPSILTSLGVFGTFVGIFIGLLNFDVQKIDESIPGLLDGLSTAFLSSVLGLFAAILFRILQNTFYRSKTSTGAGEDPSILLNNMTRSIEAQTRAIVGEEDQSLLSQLKLLRTDLNDNSSKSHDAIQTGFQNQIAAFESFAEKMAENNSQALIEALEKVIRDFNQNLTEQFGENFKQLNIAVGKLLEWQERYKLHVEQMEQQIANAVTSIEAVEKSILLIANKSSAIPETMRSLDETVTKAGLAIGAVGGLVATVAIMGDKAEVAFPKIEQNIDQLTTTLQTSAKAQAKALEDAAEELASNMNESVEQTQKGINKNFETFDEQMQNELQRAMELLGRQLGSISEKLTSDYSKFADSASKYIELAANAE